MSPEQFRSVDHCAALREGCRDAIYAKLDEQHRETLDAIGKINSRLDYADGERAAAQRNAEDEVQEQCLARADARHANTDAVAAATSAREAREGEGFWKNPIVVLVAGAVITVAVLWLLRSIPW